MLQKKIKAGQELLKKLQIATTANFPGLRIPVSSESRSPLSPLDGASNKWHNGTTQHAENRKKLNPGTAQPVQWAILVSDSSTPGVSADGERAEQGREGRKRLKRSHEPLTVAKTAKRTDNPAKEITPVRPSSLAYSPM